MYKTHNNHAWKWYDIFLQNFLTFHWIFLNIKFLIPYCLYLISSVYKNTCFGYFGAFFYITISYDHLLTHHIIWWRRRNITFYSFLCISKKISERKNVLKDVWSISFSVNSNNQCLSRKKLYHILILWCVKYIVVLIKWEIQLSLACVN